MRTPYYEDDRVTLYHGDTLEVMAELASEGQRFGQVVTSPPYNLRTLSGDGFGPPDSSGRRGGGTYFKRLVDGYDTHDDAMPHEDYVAWQRACVAAMWALLTDDGAIYYNHKPRVGGERVRLPLELVPPELPIRQVIVWDRGSGFNRQFTYYVPAHEWILLVAKPEFRTNTRSVDDVWRIPIESSSDHPAPFPLSLARRAIETTNAQSILDPFAGSGTTLRAAADCGRRAVGIEKSETYCDMIVRRMGQGALDFGGVS